MKRLFSWGLMIGLLVLMTPTLSTAGIIFSIDDRNVVALGLVGTSPYGFDPTSLNVQINNTATEGVDVHGEYISLLNLANGQTLSVNFNFLEAPGDPQAGLISDTLNIAFTGHTPIAGDLNNMSVDLHFRSDAEPNTLPTLTNPIVLTETGGFQNLQSLIAQNTGVTDFNISVASGEVPEPATLTFFLIGIAGVYLGRLKVRKESRFRS
jgi:hypothetical protein